MAGALCHAGTRWARLAGSWSFANAKPRATLLCTHFAASVSASGHQHKHCVYTQTDLDYFYWSEIQISAGQPLNSESKRKSYWPRTVWSH